MTATLKPRQRTPREETIDEVKSLLRYIRDYTRCRKPACIRLIEEFHAAYQEANFSIDGHYNTTRDEADVLKAVADYVCRERGLPNKTHAELEAECN